MVIDECHRISGDGGTQYTEVLSTLRLKNPRACILGLTATPYRLDTGWIYQVHNKGIIRSAEERFFRRCLFELTLKEMIESRYLTPPVQIDAPVASYDFSKITSDLGRRPFSRAELEGILKDQSRITPVIVENILDLSRGRNGVLIFASTVSHARHVLSLLPEGESALVLGETETEERDETIESFKSRRIKYLVNVSVLTTGFDAPHVDLIAILRPTESVSLYQQIVGRGLRLFDGKEDCLVLDYTGVPHDILRPEISDRRPFPEAVPVKVSCPKCSTENDFWGVKDDDGDVVEHFGKKCRGAVVDPESTEIVPCGFRHRVTVCPACQAENDYLAKSCDTCGTHLKDDETKLREANSAKDAHVMRPETMTFEMKTDGKGKDRLEVRYYDLDGQFLSEVFFFDNDSGKKVFHYNFSRFHNRTPGRRIDVDSIDRALGLLSAFRLPLYVIARKQGKYWRIREKIFM